MRVSTLRKSYAEVNKIVNRTKYTKEHWVTIRKFEGVVNSGAENVKELETSLDNFNNALGNIETDREKFITASDRIVSELKEWFRGQNKPPKKGAWDK